MSCVNRVSSCCYPSFGIFLFAIFCGCGGPAYQLDTAPVSGRVTLDGEPLTEGVIQVLPKKGRMARALIQPDGTFELSTYGDGDGVQVGTYPATVSNILRDGMPKQSTTPTVQIPKRYARPATSGLTIDVKAGESNQVELALTTKPL